MRLRRFLVIPLILVFAGCATSRRVQNLETKVNILETKVNSVEQKHEGQIEEPRESVGYLERKS